MAGFVSQMALSLFVCVSCTWVWFLFGAGGWHSNFRTFKSPNLYTALKEIEALTVGMVGPIFVCIVLQAQYGKCGGASHGFLHHCFIPCLLSGSLKQCGELIGRCEGLLIHHS
jgi:hypothetical protein